MGNAFADEYFPLPENLLFFPTVLLYADLVFFLVFFLY